MATSRISGCLRVVLSIAGLAFSSLVLAQPTLHNTGVDGSDNLVAAGAAASFWTLSQKPAAASQALGSSPFRYHTGSYFVDTSTAAWVSPSANGSAGASGNYVYSLQVDLGTLDPATVIVTGAFGTDNDGAIWLNDGTPVATTGFAGFGSETAFTIDDGWVSGVNTVNVRVNNGGDPTAFYVRFDSAEGEPGEPPVVAKPSTPVPTLGAVSKFTLAFVLLLVGAAVLRRF